LAEPAAATPTFGARLGQAFARFGPLCVGIDPHRWLLEEWHLPDSPDGLREFGFRVVEASAGSVGIVKPQVAFFERHGAAGYAALESVLAAARSAGLLVIADAKRGDLGSSVEAYGQAWFTPGSALECDALTLSAYMGVASIEPPMALAQANGKGVFVLAATSNPEASGLQHSVMGGTDRKSVAAGIVGEVIDRTRPGTAPGIASLGVVIGATVDCASYGIDRDELAAARIPILAPGFGHQGARIDQLRSQYGAAAPFAVVSVSRSILAAGRDQITRTIAEHARQVAECLA
jgi:orotidine-5'-phosphate decarboxylase